MKLNARSIALCAVLTALALGLSTLENLFPVTLIVPLPGVKLGLANIVTVFALYELGAVPALTILTARCLLGGLFAGNLSALLFSLLGGFTAMLVMIALKHCKGLSIYGVSIGGAAAHNIGQMAAALITLGNTAVLGYLPFLLVVSLFTGALTGFVSALLLRAIENLLHNTVGHNAVPVHVTIRADAADGMLTIQVTDDGQGYPPAVLAVLQAGETGENPPHILGLHVVEQILAAHGGTAAFAQALPHGAAAALTLPL